LTGINSTKDSIEVSAIPYDKLKKIIENNNIQRRILIIDACYSGLAAQDAEGNNYTEDELDIKGTYVLTSSGSAEVARFDTDSPNTYFTEELISAFKKKDCQTIKNLYHWKISTQH